MSDTPSTEIAPVRPISLDDDGLPYYEDTGEYLEVNAEAPIEIVERFTITCEASAEWALQRKAERESEILRIKALRDAMVRSANELIKREERKLAWLSYRFDNDLIRWAREALKGGKSKTLKLIGGSISFRRGKGARAILDEDKAVEFVQTWTPKLVRWKRLPIRLEDIDAAVKAATEACEGEDFGRLDFVAGGEEKESVTIKTGLKQLGDE